MCPGPRLGRRSCRTPGPQPRHPGVDALPRPAHSHSHSPRITLRAPHREAEGSCSLSCWWMRWKGPWEGSSPGTRCFGCSAEEQLHSPSKRLCRAAPRASAGCSHGATSPKHPVQRSWGALRDKAKFLLENVIFGSWSLREVGRSRAETGFWKSRRIPVSILGRAGLP